MAKSILQKPVDFISGKLKKTAWSSIVESLVVLIFGVLFAAWPGMTYYVVSVVIGVILIIVGIFQIVNYFVSNGQNDFFDNSLIFGVVEIIIGIAAVCFVGETFNVLRIIIGIWLVFEALVRLNTTIKLHAAHISAWGWVLAVAALMLCAGLFVLFNTELLLQFVGGFMIFAGVIGIIGDFIFIGQVDSIAKNLKK